MYLKKFLFLASLILSLNVYAKFERADVTFVEGVSPWIERATGFNQFVKGTDLVNVIAIAEPGPNVCQGPCLMVAQYSTKENKLTYLKAKYFEVTTYYSDFENNVAVSSDGKKLAFRKTNPSTHDECLEIVDLVSFEKGPSCFQTDKYTRDLTFDPSSQYLASWIPGFRPSEKFNIAILDLNTGQTKYIQYSHDRGDDSAELLAINMATKKVYFRELIASRGEERQLTVRDADTGNLLVSFAPSKPGYVFPQALDSQKQIVAFTESVGTFLNEYKLWDLKIDKEMPLKKKIISESEINEISFPWIIGLGSPIQNDVRFFNIQTGEDQIIDFGTQPDNYRHAVNVGRSNFNQNQEKIAILTGVFSDRQYGDYFPKNVKVSLELWVQKKIAK